MPSANQELLLLKLSIVFDVHTINYLPVAFSGEITKVMPDKHRQVFGVI